MNAISWALPCFRWIKWVSAMGTFPLSSLTGVKRCFAFSIRFKVSRAKDRHYRSLPILKDPVEVMRPTKVFLSLWEGVSSRTLSQAALIFCLLSFSLSRDGPQVRRNRGLSPPWPTRDAYSFAGHVLRLRFLFPLNLVGSRSAGGWLFPLLSIEVCRRSATSLKDSVCFLPLLLGQREFNMDLSLLGGRSGTLTI